MTKKKIDVLIKGYINKKNSILIWPITILVKSTPLVELQAIYLRNAKNHYKNKFQFFAYLLALLLAGQPHFCFEAGLLGFVVLVIGLAINKAILIAGKIAVGLSKRFL